MKRLLIVDDEQHVLRILKLALERAGYLVDTCSNGADALEYLRRQTPDALITDIQMPRMTGEELCRRIEQDDPGRRYPIFVITSRTEVEHRQWSARIDNLHFIEKPVSMRNLLNQLHQLFSEEPKA
jgi:DNA-binding response OmpR family regulator